MKKIILTFIVATFGISTYAPLFAQIAEFASTNELLIRFRDGEPQTYIDSLKTLYQANELGITPLTKVRLWKVAAFSTRFPTIIEVTEDAKGRVPKVVGATPNNRTVGRDSLLRSGSGDADADRMMPPSLLRDARFDYPIAKLNTFNVESLRQPIKIAIMDSGIDGFFYGNNVFKPFDSQVAQFGGMYAGGYDFVNNTDEPKDSLGHGTHVAGIIAQVIKATPAATARQVQLLILKTQDKNGYGSLWNLCRAFDYAMQQDATITNLSLGWVTSRPTPLPTQRPILIDNNNEGNRLNTNLNFNELINIEPLAIQTQPIMQFVINFANNYNQMLVIGAAGNNTNDVENTPLLDIFPAKLTNTNLVVVNGIKNLSSLATSSNWGNQSVDIAAIGTQVYSTHLGGTFRNMDGTSMATPMVTATAALMRLKTPTMLPIAIINQLKTTVNVKPFLTTKNRSRGILNILRALNIQYLSKQVSGETIPSAVTITPNPFTENIMFHIPSDAETIAKVLIYNTLGNLIFEKEVNCQIGTNVLEWQSNDASKGLYIVQVKINEHILTQKIVKQ
jgi:hypothetical protein